MSARHLIEGEIPAPHGRHRKIGVARHAPGSNAMGWLLLGFVMGAGAAIAVLVNADFVRHAPQEPYAVRVALTPHVETPIARPSALVLPPAALGPTLAPAVALPSKPLALASSEPAPAKSRIKRPATTADVSQVTQDAAAVGMTSRTDNRPNDLY